jgi:DNA-binding NarL/FixJ family response regulator
MLPIALISPSPLVRAGLEAGLAGIGGFELCLSTASLPLARAAAFGQALVAIVDAAGEPYDRRDPDAAADTTADAITRPAAMPAEAGPPLLLLVPRHRASAALLRDGFSVLPRDAPIGLIAAAAHAAAAGLVACTPAVAAETLSPRGLAAAADDDAGPALERLTPRERQVLEQMIHGLGNREIGDSLHISTHTAKFHVAQIIAKLEASSRAHAVAKALRAGLVVT